MIKVINACKSYARKKIIDIDNLEIIDNGIVFIKGKSGVGKTTFINCLSGLDSFDQGKIILNNLEVDNIKEYCSFVFQDFQLFDRLSVYDNLLLSKDNVDEAKIDNVLDKLEISDIKYNKAYNISAGQKQRVAFARALLQERNIIILDEPISNLDEDTSNIVLKIVKELSSDKLFIVVSHEKIGIDYFDQEIVIAKEGISSRIVNNVVSNDIPKSKKSRLSLKNKFKLAFSMNKKAGLSVVTCIILSLCFSFVGIISSITLQNKEYREYETYKQLNYTAFNFVNYLEFDDDYNIDSSKYLTGYLGDYGGYSYNKLFYTKDFSEYEPEIFTLNRQFSYYSHVVGEEIVFYSKYDDKIVFGDKVYELKENEVILSTQYREIIEGNTIDLIKEGNTYYVKDFIDLGKQFIMCFSGNGFKHFEYDNYKKYDHAKFIFTELLDNKNTGTIIFDHKSDGCTVLEGRLPTKKNEVLISQEFKKYLERNPSFNGESFSITIGLNGSYELLDENEKYKTFNEEFMITGVYEGDSYFPLIVTEEECFRLFENYTCSSYRNALRGFAIYNPTYEQFLNLKKNNIGVYSTRISNILEQVHSADGYLRYIPYFCIFFGIIGILMLFLYNKVIFNVNQKEYGILISLDYDRRLIWSLQTIQMAVLGAFVFIFSVLGESGLRYLINLFGRKMLGNDFDCLFYIWQTPFIIFALFIVFILINGVISLINVLRKNNISLIYSKSKK